MEYNLSIVHIIDDSYKDIINQLAESYGCGENNITVKTFDSDGNVFWGCHSWWKQEDYDLFNQEMQTIDDIEIKNAISKLKVSVVINGLPKENWDNTLKYYNLSE